MGESCLLRDGSGLPSKHLGSDEPPIRRVKINVKGDWQYWNWIPTLATPVGGEIKNSEGQLRRIGKLRQSAQALELEPARPHMNIKSA